MSNSVQVSSFTLPDVNYRGTTAKLRRYYTVNWTDQDGVFHLSGTPGSLTDAFDEIDCTLANHTLTVPGFSACVTLFNGANPYAREIWQLWDQANHPRNILTGDAGWFIPLSPDPTTRAILEIANQGQFLLWPPNIYLNAVGVQALIDAQLGVYGTALLVAGNSTTVPMSAVESNSAIEVIAASDNITGNLRAFNRVPHVSFDFQSDNGADEGAVMWRVKNV